MNKKLIIGAHKKILLKYTYLFILFIYSLKKGSF